MHNEICLLGNTSVEKNLHESVKATSTH